MADYSFLFFIALGIGVIVALSVWTKKVKEKRAALTAETADKLGGTYQSNNSTLTQNIKVLMGGERSARISNAIYFDADNGRQLIWAEYSHVVNSGKSSSRVYRTTLVLSLNDEDDVPPFSLRRKRFMDSIGGWFGWAPIESPYLAELNETSSLFAKRDKVDAVRDYFEARSELAQFCQYNRDYSLASNGRCLVFYKPNRYLEPTVDHVSREIEKGRELGRLVWAKAGSYTGRGWDDDFAPPEPDWLKELKGGG